MIARCVGEHEQVNLKDYDSKQTDHYYEETQKALKQIEVEAMGFMHDDAVRKRVSSKFDDSLGGQTQNRLR